MKEEKLTPALLNQKDVLEDALFEQIFDNEMYVAESTMKPNTALGYITGIPCILEWTWNDNTISVKPLLAQSHTTHLRIISRLTMYNKDPYCPTVCKTEIEGDEVYASYFYKN